MKSGSSGFFRWGQTVMSEYNMYGQIMLMYQPEEDALQYGTALMREHQGCAVYFTKGGKEKMNPAFAPSLSVSDSVLPYNPL
ncbi:MAG: hypothetical protein LUD00_03375 [Prevotellaceae bacterium]|nr:hypothetical protein [Prevotellaceae bacterium]